MDLLQIKAATDEVVAALPVLRTFIDSQRAQVQEALTESLNNALAGLADGVSQVVAVGLALDGATIQMEIEPIVIPAIRAKWTVSMPLKATGAKPGV